MFLISFIRLCSVIHSQTCFQTILRFHSWPLNFYVSLSPISIKLSGSVVFVLFNQPSIQKTHSLKRIGNTSIAAGSQNQIVNDAIYQPRGQIHKSGFCDILLHIDKPDGTLKRERHRYYLTSNEIHDTHGLRTALTIDQKNTTCIPAPSMKRL